MRRRARHLGIKEAPVLANEQNCGTLSRGNLRAREGNHSLAV